MEKPHFLKEVMRLLGQWQSFSRKILFQPPWKWVLKKKTY